MKSAGQSRQTFLFIVAYYFNRFHFYSTLSISLFYLGFRQIIHLHIKYYMHNNIIQMD